MADLKEKMIAALKEKQNDVRNFVWKGEKIKTEDGYTQETVKLWDCELPQLQKYYDHCEMMLYNESKDHPGRYPLLKIVSDQRQRCNCELFLRWLEDSSNLKISKFRFMEQLREIISNKKADDPDILSKPISSIVDGCPDEFQDLSLGLVLDGCLDLLGKFSRQHITLLFIVKQGICLTDEDKQELTSYDEKGNLKDRLQVIKERLSLNTPIKLFMSPTGLSFKQFRAMTMLRYRKYSELTTMQLTTLRNRMLFQLEDSIHEHIRQWEEREKIIEEICKLKGYDLVR